MTPSLPSEPYAALTYDPQLTGQRFAFQKGPHAGKDIKNAPAALVRDPRDDESCVMPRWVSTDVGKACVKRDQGGLFQLAAAKSVSGCPRSSSSQTVKAS